DCEEGDCSDWFRVETPDAGTLRIAVVRVADERELPEFSVTLADSDGKELARATSGGKDRVRLAHPKRKGSYAPAGRYRVAVQTRTDGEGALACELRAAFAAKPQPVTPAAPAPRFRTVPAALLEVEKRADGSTAVLIDQGSRAGIAVGQRGRLR